LSTFEIIVFPFRYIISVYSLGNNEIQSEVISVSVYSQLLVGTVQINPCWQLVKLLWLVGGSTTGLSKSLMNC